jgi:hypothetical protein
MKFPSKMTLGYFFKKTRMFIAIIRLLMSPLLGLRLILWITHNVLLMCNPYGRHNRTKEKHLSLLWISQKATKELTAPLSEIDRNQTAMGLPPVTSAVLLIAKYRTNYFDDHFGVGSRTRHKFYPHTDPTYRTFNQNGPLSITYHASPVRVNWC